MLYMPPLDGRPTQLILAAFLICAPIFFWTERGGRLAFGYSKFADRTRRFAVPSRIGMLIIYAPAAVAGLLCHIALDGPWTVWHGVTLGTVALHFVRRCLEVLFVHRYSGVTHLGSALLISSLYASVSALLAWIGAAEVDPALLASPDFAPAWIAGLALWIAGSATNIGHHLLLARLRRPGETGYVLPRGGLFAYVACPHYLGEIIGWFGLALVFHHAGAVVIAITMTFYLGGRADNTLRWYRARFETLPAGWKRIVPFVY